MKKLKYLFTATLLAISMIFAVGCYRVDAQKMEKVVGTYELVTYTRTNGDTDKVTDYIAEYGYETYLVVTSTGLGYFAHKNNTTAAYAKEVQLTYGYNEEKTNLVEYVSYKDSLNSSTLAHDKFGVVKDGLNYSRPVVKVNSKIFSNIDGLDFRWEKVSDDTDLSYVREKLGAMKEYTYEGYAANGIYEISSYSSEDNTTVLPSEQFPYQYYFVALDAATMKATTVYALKTDLQRQSKTEDVVLVDGWQQIQIGQTVWTKGQWSYEYSRSLTVGEGENALTHIEHLNQRQRVWTDADLEEMIAGKLPVTE